MHAPRLELESIQAKSSIGIKLGAFKWMIGKTSKQVCGMFSAYVLRLFRFYTMLCWFRSFCHHSPKRSMIVNNMGPWPYPIVILVTM